MRSSARALLMLARSLGANISSKDIEVDYNIDEHELSLDEMKGFLIKQGIESDVLEIDIDNLVKILKNQRVLLRLKNDRTVIAVRAYKEEEQDSIVVIDPTDNSLQPRPISSTELKNIWAGSCLAAKNTLIATEDDETITVTQLILQLLREKSLIVPIFLLSIFGHLISLTPLIFLIITLDKVIGYQGVSTLYVLVFGVSISFAFGAIFRFMRDKSILLLGHKIHAQLSRKAIEATLDLPYPYITANQKIISQTSARVDRIRNFIKSFLSNTFYDFIGFLVFIPLLISFSIQLFAILVVFTILGIALSYYGQIVQKNQRDNLMGARGVRSNSFRGIIEGLETIKSLGIESRMMKRWFDTEGSFIDADESHSNSQAYWRELTTLLQNFLSVALLFVGAILVLAESIPVGAMLGFYLLSQKIFSPLTNLSRFYQDLKDADSELASINKVILMEKEKGFRGIKPDLLGGVRFEEVTFAYPGKNPILKKINLDIAPLSFVGITGPSGAGKSTIIKLMQKFYRPTSGVVNLDQNDLRTIDPSFLRSNFSVVTSSDYFSADKIKQNLLLPLNSPDLGRMDWAIDKAGARPFISSLDEGVDTFLQTNAVNISSGQRQLLSLARGLITNPRIIALDDALTQLGPELEFQIIQTLQKLREGRTIILVSNQVWHLQLCDKIFVLDDGIIKESGSWEELMSCPSYIKRKMDEHSQLLLNQSANLKKTET